MESQTRLVFALHFHQPYGNLDEVFADATDRCYLRTLELLESSPHVRTAIHVSGPLLDWAEAHRPVLIDKLSALVARGQVELLGGGYQEPMLAILPDRDAIGQLEVMADRCESLLGKRPVGMWLAERVWEPDLPRVIARAGYRYTLLDDSHLRAAGAREPLGEYYVTDKAGAAIAVFPIDRGLRTRVPYAEVEELVAYLETQKGRSPTYGDDVEKFGLWPTTERRVWHDRWLERFFNALETESAWLSTITPSELLAATPASGSVYLPTISYQEMGAWALPPDASSRFVALGERLRFAGYADDTESFLRGGIWQAFLAKYPESNVIYRKMLRVSEAVERAAQAKHPKAEEARAALYRGQCNCAYWHGLFGGLYLQHLRSALMQALIEAETLIDTPKTVRLSQADHDGDLVDELLFDGPRYNIYVSPRRGGSAFELDLRDAQFHLTGVLGRRKEAYHEDVARARVVSDEELGNISAHDLVRATEEGLASKLKLDAYPRGMFVDHLLARTATLEALDGDYHPLADFANVAHIVRNAEQNGQGATASLHAQLGGYTLDKTMRVEPTHMTMRYRLASKHTEAFTFCSHIDVTLLSPDTVGGRRIVVDGEGEVDERPGTRGIATAVRSVRVACDDLGVDVRITPNAPVELWRVPIETVSQSERGFERSYQGTALVFVWRCDSSSLEASLRVDVA